MKVAERVEARDVVAVGFVFVLGGGFRACFGLGERVFGLGSSLGFVAPSCCFVSGLLVSFRGRVRFL